MEAKFVLTRPATSYKLLLLLRILFLELFGIQVHTFWVCLFSVLHYVNNTLLDFNSSCLWIGLVPVKQL